MVEMKPDRVARRALGAFYTPDDLALQVVGLALRNWQGKRAPSLLDPACGDGAFLAAGLQLANPAAVVGVDVDPGALEAARNRLAAEDADVSTLVLGDGLNPRLLGDRRFDLILGNPPFGLKRDDARVWGLDVNRTDSYAAFLAMGLARLAPGGILAFITADTWLSIRSHEALRRLLLPHLREVRLLPHGAFDAVVNTCVVVLAREPVTEAILAYERPDVVYEIPCALTAALPGNPIFIGSPALAELAADGETRLETVSPGHTARVRTIFRNGTPVRLVRLGDIAATPHGISTGNNARYVRVEPGTPGRLPIIQPAMRTAPERLARVDDDERQHGFRATGGPCHVPFDKGAASHTEDGWLPNYYVPCPYWIDWSEEALADMRRNPGFAWKNWRYFFRPGLTFSVSGAYSPTFRLNAGGVFEAKSSGLFCDALDPELLLGILCSRTARYLFKVYIKHTVDTSGHDIARFPLVLPPEPEHAAIRALVRAIIAKQRRDPRYPYHRAEQPELDARVARCYGLSAGETEEIDAWFSRRYPRLSGGRATSPKTGS
jgi:hypothetical protein